MSNTYNPYADGTFTIEVNTTPVESKNENGNSVKTYRWALLFFNCGEKFTILNGYCSSIEEASQTAIQFYKDHIMKLESEEN